MKKSHFAVFSYLTYSIENPFSYFPNSFRRRVLGSSAVLAAFSTMGAGASVGSVGEGGETP
jgi:hypothetical protein